jgi:hypothetical protein
MSNSTGRGNLNGIALPALMAERVTTGIAHPSTGLLGEGATADDISNQLSLERSRELPHLYCALCARDASYALVLKHGSTYCSIECASAVPGIYVG